jgi:hypothetical protein
VTRPDSATCSLRPATTPATRRIRHDHAPAHVSAEI